MNLDKIIAVRNSKTIYRDGNKCLKFFNKVYSKAKVLNEAYNQSRAEETELPVPKVLEVKKIDEKWVIISEFIKGETLEEIMKTAPEKNHDHLEKLIDIQCSVYTKSSDFLQDMNSHIIQNISKSNLEESIKNSLLSTLIKIPEQKDFCHGDINPSNIIITEDNKAFIVDWAHASRGNRIADAALTFLFFRYNHDDKTAALYLETFCSKTGITKDQFEEWIPIMAASKYAKANERERNFLMSFIKNNFKIQAENML